MTEHGGLRTPVTPTVGHPGIDGVLDLLSGLDRRPVEEHAPVYAEAHEQLRHALEHGLDAPGPG